VIGIIAVALIANGEHSQLNGGDGTGARHPPGHRGPARTRHETAQAGGWPLWAQRIAAARIILTAFLLPLGPRDGRWSLGSIPADSPESVHQPIQVATRPGSGVLSLQVLAVT
jgi:hypothetical protein